MTQRILTREEIADAMEKGVEQIREVKWTYFAVDGPAGYCGCADGALAVGLVGSPKKAYKKHNGFLNLFWGMSTEDLLRKYGVPKSFSNHVSCLHSSGKTTRKIVEMTRAGELDPWLVDSGTN